MFIVWWKGFKMVVWWCWIELRVGEGEVGGGV